MNAPTNGSLKKIVIGVVTALILGLITQVAINANRITVVETKMLNFEKTADSNKDDLKRELQQNRNDNNEQHKIIIGMIKELKDDLKPREKK